MAGGDKMIPMPNEINNSVGALSRLHTRHQWSTWLILFFQWLSFDWMEFVFHIQPEKLFYGLFYRGSRHTM